MHDKIKYFIGYIIISSFIIIPTHPYIDNTLNRILIFKKRYETKSDLNRIKKLLIQYKLEKGKFPPEHRFIVWFKNNSKNQFRFKFPLDRWGEKIFYKLTNNKKGFILRSSGEDKKIGNKDDIEIKFQA